MKASLTVILALAFPVILFSQAAANKPGGQLSLGMRTTTSGFSSAGENFGFGYGGHWRLRINERINTEWYADYITTDLSGIGARRDVHIGWSVQFYMLYHEHPAKKLTPFFEAGHCFDHTQISATFTSTGLYNVGVQRWSSAVHTGIGMHYNFTDNFDLTAKAQYMNHLGNAIKTDVVDDAGTDVLIISQDKGLSLEGHLLATVSLNIVVGDLWKNKK